MHVYDFITPKELDQAPEEPVAAFTYIVSVAQQRLKSRVDQRDADDGVWEINRADRFAFQSFVVSAAKQYDVEEFSGYRVLASDDADEDRFLREFERELSHYVAQVILGNARRSKSDSVEFAPNLKDRLRAHVAALRKAIDDNDSLTAGRKSALHAKLREFEEALDGGRVPLWKLTKILLGVMSVSANGLQLYDSPTVHRLINNMWSSISEAKAGDDEQRRLPPLEPPKILMPPRRTREQSGKPRDVFSSGLDDEIPF